MKLIRPPRHVTRARLIAFAQGRLPATAGYVLDFGCPVCIALMAECADCTENGRKPHVGLQRDEGDGR